MPAPILLGESQFLSLRERGALYVDKSGFVNEVLTAPAMVLLYPRPRRFGKTLNLTMLHAFFEIGPDRSWAFQDLSIWLDPQARAHFQKHPVVYLTFKDTKYETWVRARQTIQILLTDEISRHREALTDPRVPPEVVRRLERVLTGTARPSDEERSLRDLCVALHIHHGAQPILLIDEYDSCVLHAWEKGYYDESVEFFRALLSPALKDNPHLYKGVLTGILRIAKESMFSGLNNVEVYSLLNQQRGEYFGFTEPEVFQLLDAFGRGGERAEVARWYNGYRFGRTTVYNPWSITRMLNRPGEPLTPHWLGTSDNALVRSLLLQNPDLGPQVETLLRGGAVAARIEENVPLRDLRGHHIWSLFLFSGYLRAENVETRGTQTWADLTIPNLEVGGIWRDTFTEWIGGSSGQVAPLHAALLGGNAPKVEELLRGLLLRNASVHDSPETQDELFYHAFVLGLLVTMENTHAVRSNRESGEGRPDLLILPKRPGLPGVVLEFKRKRGKTPLATSARAALKQIIDRNYAVEVEAAGASVVRKFGIAFSGKEVVVRGEKVAPG